MEKVLNAQNKEVIKEKEHPQIVGVQILRFYMAFMVVAAHLGGAALFKLGGLFYLFQAFHVPVFMLLSFLLCGRYFLSPTKDLIIKRVLRILIPFALWSVLSYFLSLILWNNLSPITLVNQLLTGYPLNNPLWYLVVTFWICILFWITRLITGKNKSAFIIVISVLSVICIVLQYTGLYYRLFNGLDYNVKFTIGRFFEMIPYAAIGIIGSMVLPYLTKLDKKFHLIIFVSAFVLMTTIAILRDNVISYRPLGFDFLGVSLIVVAILLVLTAFTNPINWITNKVFKNIIKWITSFTLGVFCMHVVIGRYVEWVFVRFSLTTYNIWMVLVTYIVCYLISFLIWLIPNKFVRQIVN